MQVRSARPVKVCFAVSSLLGPLSTGKRRGMDKDLSGRGRSIGPASFRGKFIGYGDRASGSRVQFAKPNSGNGTWLDPLLRSDATVRGNPRRSWGILIRDSPCGS